MRYIDTHCHLNFKDFDEDRDEVISRAKENDLGMIQIGTGLNTSKEVVELVNKNENMWAHIGLHPIYTPEESEFLEEEFQKLLDEDIKKSKNDSVPRKIVGVGECGLDYFHLKGESDEEISAEKKIQENVFRAQINFAIKNDLPIMIHCRNAYDDVLNILKEYKEKLKNGEIELEGLDNDENVENRLRGNCHFFAGTIDHAEAFIDLGFTISFTGVITFAKEYANLVRFVPIEFMHAETDSPYVAPIPFRGRRNEPNFVIKVVNKIAELKELPVEEVEEQLIKNARRVYKLN